MRAVWKIASVDLRYLKSAETTQVSAFKGTTPNTPIYFLQERMIFIDKRDRKLLIRVNSDEYEVIKKKADKLNLRVAVYIRRMAVQGEIKRYDLSELRDITRSFRMIGMELNQIAKVANSTGEVTGKAVEEIKRQYEILEGVFENYLKPLKPNVIL